MVATIHRLDESRQGEGRDGQPCDRFAWLNHVRSRVGAAEFRVAHALCEFVNSETGLAWPSMETIAKRVPCDVRTVRRRIGALERRGLIVVTTPATHHTTKRWRLAIVSDDNSDRTTLSGHNSQDTDDRTSLSVRPDNPVIQTGQSCPPEPSKEPKKEPGNLDQQSFDEFWKVYPRRAAKKAAMVAWTKAVKTATPEEIIRGAIAYHASRTGKDPQHTAHAATWLNGERWTDEPQTHTGQTHERTYHAGGGKPRGGGFGRLYETSDADTSKWRLAVDGETAQ